MTEEQKPTDDLRTAARARTAPANPADGRFDYGDAEQLAEMAGADAFATDDPVELVDTPAQLQEPVSRAKKKRNQQG